MIDFSKIFDIVFASVAVAVMLFLLISTIAVAARGKRKCGGFDVVLRIVSTLVLIVAAVMFAAAILTMLEGSFRILLQSETPEKTVAFLIVSGKQIELPLVDLFILLSSVVGSNLVAMLLICALAALIVDCVVANKKEVKKRPHKNEKTLEQRKREAELRRIRNLGESAVRKADAAASQDATATTEKQDDEEPQTDWREEPKAQEEHTEFVGIKDDAPDDFDSFDDVEQETEQTESEADGTQAEEQTTDEQLVTEDEFTEQELITEDESVQEDAFAEESTDGLTQNEFAEQEAEAETDEFIDEQAETEQAFEEEYTYEEEPVEDEQAIEDEVIEDEQADEQELAEETDEDDMSGWAYESDENVADEQLETEQATEAEQEVAAEQAERVENAEEPTALDIEPDRNIYIPEMRTIEPAQKAAPKKSETSAKKSPAASKPKTAKPKKSGNQAAKKQKAAQPEKKLPVTRKYVILDRRNAVNMFGEYLKERNKAQKEKLESSIDTIIIE